MSRFYILPRFDPSMLANKNMMSVSFGPLSGEEAGKLLDREGAIRRGFGDEVELEPGDWGVLKDARGRWTLFRVGSTCRSTLAEAVLGPIQKRETHGTDSSGSDS